MTGIGGPRGAERPGQVFFGLVSLIVAIALETLVGRVADLVRAGGWSLELAALAGFTGLALMFMWMGYAMLVLTLRLILGRVVGVPPGWGGFPCLPDRGHDSRRGGLGTGIPCG